LAVYLASADSTRAQWFALIASVGREEAEQAVGPGRQ
jgi:hypothetical protein